MQIYDHIFNYRNIYDVHFEILVGVFKSVMLECQYSFSITLEVYEYLHISCQTVPLAIIDLNNYHKFILRKLHV